ncbi:MAG: type II toxin-antitoxin system VapC family toxin [Pseudolabrys sp.]
MTLVVDASVAVKWVLSEPGSPNARSLQAEGGLIAPSLIAAEVGNALWKAVRRDGFARQDALDAIRTILLAFDALIPIEDLRLRALELSLDLGHPIYDCFYLALAERERAPLVCVDGSLKTKAKKLKQIEIRTL